STLRIELDELKRKNRGVPRAGSFRPRFESYDLDQRFDLNRRGSASSLQTGSQSGTAGEN
ncbi:MAG: hypothetical protein AAGK78_04925, partial [Planctomycetota bacterium]